MGWTRPWDHTSEPLCGGEGKNGRLDTSSYTKVPSPRVWEGSQLFPTAAFMRRLTIRADVCFRLYDTLNNYFGCANNPILQKGN